MMVMMVGRRMSSLCSGMGVEYQPNGRIPRSTMENRDISTHIGYLF